MWRCIKDSQDEGRSLTSLEQSSLRAGSAMSPSPSDVTVRPLTGMVQKGNQGKIQRSVAVEGTFANENEASAYVPEAVFHAYRYALASSDRLFL